MELSETPDTLSPSETPSESAESVLVRLETARHTPKPTGIPTIRRTSRRSKSLRRARQTRRSANASRSGFLAGGPVTRFLVPGHADRRSCAAVGELQARTTDGSQMTIASGENGPWASREDNGKTHRRPEAAAVWER